jgi:hypothetical protein
MLLLYDNPSNWQKLSPEEMQQALEKYMAWMKKPSTVDAKRLDPNVGKALSWCKHIRTLPLICPTPLAHVSLRQRVSSQPATS